MTTTTAPIDVEGELIAWLNNQFASFDITTIAGTDAVRHSVTGVRWTDGRPLRVRERSKTPTLLKLPYGTVTYLHSYGWDWPYHTKRKMVEEQVAVVDESIPTVAGQDTYQVRFRDIHSVQDLKVDGVSFSGTGITTTKDYYTPDAVVLSAAALAAIGPGSVIQVSYKYRVYNAGSYLQGYEVYRLEGKAGDYAFTVGATPYQVPASRLAKMWLDDVSQRLHVAMNGNLFGHEDLRICAAGDSESGMGLLPQSDETESRFVIDVVLWRQATVFTQSQVRRVGKVTIKTPFDVS